MDDPLTLHARRAPDALAIRSEGRDLGYAELDREAARTAGRLAALGVGEGDRVATTLPAGIAFAALVHALPRLGAVLVPLNPRSTDIERARQVELCGPRLIVEEPLRGEETDVPTRLALDPGAVRTILLTSGTTAEPKPVALTYANHAASALASAWSLGVDPNDRWLCVLPVFHVGGLAILLRSALYGTAAVLHPSFDQHAAVESLESGEATLVSLVPTQLARMLDAGLEAAPELRAVLLGGAPTPAELLERAAARRIPVVRTYGMTETASQVATARADEGALALPGVELGIGEGGEVLLRGPMVAPGAVEADRWLHTGDRGWIDADGRLHVEGRMKDVIVTGGENVSAAEVEAVLAEHPAVVEAAVSGRPDPAWGEAVIAYAVPGAAVTEAELAAHCRERLAGYKVPKEIRLVDALPRTATGKVSLPGRPPWQT